MTLVSKYKFVLNPIKSKHHEKIFQSALPTSKAFSKFDVSPETGAILPRDRKLPLRGDGDWLQSEECLERYSRVLGPRVVKYWCQNNVIRFTFFEKTKMNSKFCLFLSVSKKTRRLNQVFQFCEISCAYSKLTPLYVLICNFRFY